MAYTDRPFLAAVHPTEGLLFPLMGRLANAWDMYAVLQHRILLFDSIACPLGLKEGGVARRPRPPWDMVYDDLLWLQESGFLVDLLDDPAYERTLREHIAAASPPPLTVAEAFPPWELMGNLESSEGARLEGPLRRSEAVFVHSMASAASQLGRPTLAALEHVHDLYMGHQAGKVPVASIVLDALPVPEPGGTAWDDLAKFKQEPTVRREYQELWRWIRTTAIRYHGSSEAQRDLREEIEELVLERERRLRSDGHQVRRMVVGMLVPIGAVTLGTGDVRVGLSTGGAVSIVNRCLELRSRRPEPLAYVSHARDRFGAR